MANPLKFVQEVRSETSKVHLQSHHCFVRCGYGDWGAGGDLVAVAAVIAVRGRTRVPG